MAKISFNYCALHYLNLWLSSDREPCEAMSSMDEQAKLNALSQFAKNYRIARNLPTKYDVGRGLPRYKPVFDIIDSLHPDEFRGDALVPSLTRVRQRISIRYGGRGVLSLTTKFSWLKLKHPIIIYDQRARRALDIKTGQISEYITKWRRLFDSEQSKIEAACRSLASVRHYSVDPQLATREYVAQISSEHWFRERVFDTYLWHAGR